jgi:hypothetical protein
MQAFVEPMLEPHYSPQALAEAWGFSTDYIRDLFEDEPGVLMTGNRTSKRKRRYVNMRIPASVAARVYKRLTERRDSR